MDDRVQVELLKIGVNNDKKIIVGFNFESFKGVEDIEPIHIIIGVLERLKIRLSDQIDEIQEDNATEEEDDNDFGDFPF